MTVPRILKIKGSGVQFSGSFQGGGIHVYDNRRNLFFIKSFPEEGDMFSERKKEVLAEELFYKFHPRSVIVAPYAFYSKTTQIDIDQLMTKKTLPALCVSDLEIYRGAMPVIGYRPLSERDRAIPFPHGAVTSITINLVREDIQKFIEQN